MSGIVGILSLHGGPVDASLLQALTESMAFRGPDVQRVWRGEGIGLGHALLSVAPESAREEQPLSIDGGVWIVADARIDGRARLLSELQSAGQQCSQSAADAELMLGAYAAWGEACVDHLLGDFSFAIWDATRQALFCARDQVGIKPFYYAANDHWLAFSNTLDCLRTQPWVSADLNEASVADFLLFGATQNRTATIFSHIQRLPAAHTLNCRGGRLAVRQYWTPPFDEEIHYKRSADYVDHFRGLLQTAVQDRVRSERAVISLSGGLDSTSVAAFACRTGVHELRAVTLVCDTVIPDTERHYSGLFARSQAIPVDYLACDSYYTSTAPDFRQIWSAQPTQNVLPELNAEFWKLASRTSRVLLTGEGGDVGLYPSNSHFRRLLRSGRLGRFLYDGAQYSISRRRLPPIGFRTWLQRRFAVRDKWHMDFPDWLNTDLESRLNLRERWQQMALCAWAAHPTRPEAAGALLAAYWQNCFEELDPGTTRVCLEYAHPYFDLRLLRFLFSVPPVPWTLDKYLIRSSLRNMAPEAVRLRPKTPLSGNPLLTFVRRNREMFSQVPRNIARYVDRRKYSAFVESQAAFGETGYTFPLRVTMLSAWLTQQGLSKGN